jgi:hypothetical protein
MGFDLNKEKLRCLMELDDALAMRLSPLAGPAYWRGFIVENRETHLVSAMFRFNYVDGKRNWFKIKPKTQANQEAAMLKMRCGMEAVIKTALSVFGVESAVIDDAIRCHYPPDDEGDPFKTIIWLEQQDLIEFEVKRIDEGEDEPDGR